MDHLNLNEHVHRRYNPLTGEWILVSPHRSKRPWEGHLETPVTATRPAHDPACYLCPGNARAGGKLNPNYADTFVFDNDFAALQPAVSGDGLAGLNEGGLMVAEQESGICRVICFSPRHDLTLAEMDTPALTKIVDLWAAQYAELGARNDINYVQIFENKGAMMGCSNMHPHGQIWAQQTVPDEPAKESHHQLAYFQRTGQTLLAAYLQLELEQDARIVYQNKDFVVLVPFWAFWPFETIIIPRRPVPHVAALTMDERAQFADAIKQITVRYDNLFKVSFPYSAGLHQAPTDGSAHLAWHFHMHFYPPLLRSATIKKFKVGYEMLGGGQRDVSAEASASLLKALPAVHYKSL